MRGNFKLAFVSSRQIPASLVLHELQDDTAKKDFELREGEVSVGVGAILNYTTLGLSPRPVLELDSQDAFTRWKIIQRKIADVQRREFGNYFEVEVEFLKRSLATYLLGTLGAKGSRLRSELQDYLRKWTCSSSLKNGSPFGTLLVTLFAKQIRMFLQYHPDCQRLGFKLEYAECDPTLPVAVRANDSIRASRSPLPQVQPRSHFGHYQEEAHSSVFHISAGHFESNRRKF